MGDGVIEWIGKLANEQMDLAHGEAVDFTTRISSDPAYTV